MAYDDDGEFIHVTPDRQWVGKAWLRPQTISGVLFFGLVGEQGVKMTKAVYGVYHGRLIEMLLTHFDDDFSNVSPTAQKDSDVDVFK